LQQQREKDQRSLPVERREEKREGREEGKMKR